MNPNSSAISWDPRQIPTDERARFLAEFQFDPVTDLIFEPPFSMEYDKSFEWTGESELAKHCIRLGGVVYFGGKGYLTIGITLQHADQSRLVVLENITSWRNAILDSIENDVQNPPWNSLKTLLLSLEQKKAPWEVFAHFLVVIRRIASEGLVSLNPNLVPSGSHAALVRAIALAIRDLVPDVVTLSPRGIAVGGALVHPFLTPKHLSLGREWFVTKNRALAAAEEEIRGTTRPPPRAMKEALRALSAGRDALLHPEIAPAWAWIVISRALHLQLLVGSVQGPPDFSTYFDALNFIRKEHLANYIPYLDLEEATRADKVMGSAEMPDFRGVLNDLLGDVDPHGFDPLLAGKKWEVGPTVLRELVKTFEIARKANLRRWLSVDYHAFPVLEETCRKGAVSGTPVEMSYHDVRVLAELVRVVDETQGDLPQLSDDIDDALWERHRVATARAALHAIQLAPRLAEAWVQLGRVVGGPEDTHLARLMERVRGRRHAQVTTVLGAGDQQPARARACLETAVYLDVTCEEAWVALSRVPSPSPGLKILRMACEILPASLILRKELQAKENEEQSRS